MEHIICKIRENKASKQKLITISKFSSLKAGDYVQIIPVKLPNSDIPTEKPVVPDGYSVIECDEIKAPTDNNPVKTENLTE